MLAAVGVVQGFHIRNRVVNFCCAKYMYTEYDWKVITYIILRERRVQAYRRMYGM